jgi:hypothetical protein
MDDSHSDRPTINPNFGFREAQSYMVEMTQESETMEPSVHVESPELFRGILV